MLEACERVVQRLSFELDAGLAAGPREGMAARVFAERQRHDEAELGRIHDLVGLRVLQHPVLVDAGFVRERVAPDDRLVGLYRLLGHARQQLAGIEQPLRDDRGVIGKAILAHAKRHHDFLE